MNWDDVAITDFDRDETLSLLVEILGLETFKRLVEVFGGDSVYIPKAESVIRIGRDRRIWIEYKTEGYSYRALAARYNLTTRHIRGIIRYQRRINSKINETQLEMF
ncbi:MAG: hypothetical protein MI862_26595 [Desulfobacterales bacterium]|nr:hypothetical protein [Desulfobacterales bacterium]